MSVGPAEILVILIVGLLVFGPQRLPEVGRQVGSALRELRKMQDAVRGELDMVLHPEHGTGPTHAAAPEPDDHTIADGIGADGGTPEVSGPDANGDVTSREIEPPRDPFNGPSDSFL